MALKYPWILLLVLVYEIDLSRACSCMPDLTLEQQFSMASQIFIGTAINVIDDDVQMVRKIIFRVEKNFKGPPPSNGLIAIFTETMEFACGLEIKQGEKWQIWANRDESNPTQLYAGFCSPSTRVTGTNLDLLSKQLCSFSVGCS